MATQLQIRRGTASQIAAFTGAEGEVVVNTTNDSIVVSDGSTAGGFEQARADLNNVSDASLNAALTGNTVSALTITTLTLGSTAITATGAEINFVDGVTSAIQTQLDAKAPLASPTFTGTVTVPGLTTTADVSFADNDKAIFGAGSDLQIYHDGSASYINDSGTGNLKIQGTQLQLQNAAGTLSYLAGIDGGATTIHYAGFAKLATTATGIDVTGTVNADALTVDTTTLVVDATNNRLGINTGSPSRTLHSLGGSGISTVGKFEAGGTQVYVQLSSNGQINSDSGYIGYDSSKNLTLWTDNTRAITIDGSQNLMVGKTSLDVATVGHELRASGYSAATRDGATVGSFTRLNSNGTILEFRKDSAAVGNISVISNDRMVFATADGLGLQFDNDNNRIIPCDATGGANSNVSLGSSGLEFKDLYLSGGIYLGGTAAANKLEDYEETAWTPTQAGVTLTVKAAKAIRVGNLVTLCCRVTFPSNTDTNYVAITNLPYARVSGWQSAGGVMFENADLGSGYTQLSTFLGGQNINLYASKNGAGWNALRNSNASGGDFIFTVSYETNA